MNVREIAEYIALIDYHDYHAFLNCCYGMYGQSSFKNVRTRKRARRHIMYVIAFDMIMRGDF